MAPIQTPEPNRTIQDSGHNVEASLPKNRTPEAERGLRIPTSPARCNRTLRQVIEDLENANVSPSSGTRNRLEANLPSPDLSAVAELLSISKQQKNELRFGFEGLQTQSTADVAPSADWERKFGEHEGRFNEQDAKLDDLNDRMKVFQAHVAKERAVMAKVHGMKLLLLAAERLCGVQSLRRENKEESAGKDSEKGNGVGSRGRETKDDEDTPDEANTYSSSRSPTEVDSTEGVCLSDIVTKKTALHNLREAIFKRNTHAYQDKVQCAELLGRQMDEHFEDWNDLFLWAYDHEAMDEVVAKDAEREREELQQVMEAIHTYGDEF